MAKYLITGGTGLIGSALIKELTKNKSNEIICPVRNKEKAYKIYGDTAGIKIIHTNVERFLMEFEEQVDYVVHCASPTASKFFVDNPVETLQFGVDSTRAILSYACKYPIKKFLYLSSLEVYGTIEDDSYPLVEEMQGYINPLSKRSSYNMVKRYCETLCYAYYAQYNVPVCIARLTQTVSPNVDDCDNRVFVQFCRKAASFEDIVLNTPGDAARQYVFIQDAVRALLTILRFGKLGEAYNIANELSYISARELAFFIQQNFNPTGKVRFNIKDDMGYPPTTKIRLSTSKLNKLGWVAHYDLYKMAESLIKNLRCYSIKVNSNE